MDGYGFNQIRNNINACPMQGFCSDCCVPEEHNDTQVTWFIGNAPPLSRTNSTALLPPTTTQNAYTRITSNRPHPSTYVKEVLPTSEHMSTVGSPRVVSRNRLTSTVMPVERQVPLTDRLREEKIRILESQNIEYRRVINNEYAPLKRDYEYLKREYKRKLQLIHHMNLRLEEIERLYYPHPQQSKTSTNSIMTKV